MGRFGNGLDLMKNDLRRLVQNVDETGRHDEETTGEKFQRSVILPFLCALRRTHRICKHRPKTAAGYIQ